ncbi:hypothetical protein EVAR_79823_1 [Eumeta japonica]|uniref:Uncharacterized protein n=1 Tax=Eumeta variegata TaxID=151549 RepID=A0A4C1WQ33_EUMVA|nr:hypothetical protein EVAR_79823_1 [Eumeta japonica]
MCELSVKCLPYTDDQKIIALVVCELGEVVESAVEDRSGRRGGRGRRGSTGGLMPLTGEHRNGGLLKKAVKSPLVGPPAATGAGRETRRRGGPAPVPRVRLHDLSFFCVCRMCYGITETADDDRAKRTREERAGRRIRRALRVVSSDVIGPTNVYLSVLLLIRSESLSSRSNCELKTASARTPSPARTHAHVQSAVRYFIILHVYSEYTDIMCPNIRHRLALSGLRPLGHSATGAALRVAYAARSFTPHTFLRMSYYSCVRRVEPLRGDGRRAAGGGRRRRPGLVCAVRRTCTCRIMLSMNVPLFYPDHLLRCRVRRSGRRRLRGRRRCTRTPRISAEAALAIL